MHQDVLASSKAGAVLNRRLIIGALVVVLAMAYLLVVGLQENMAYYLEVDELLAKGPEVYGQRVRMGGQVVPGSITVDSRELVYNFQISQGEQAIPVYYQGVTPDIFSDQIYVIVEGEMGQDGLFSAEVLQAQCPSKMVARLTEAEETGPSP